MQIVNSKKKWLTYSHLVLFILTIFWFLPIFTPSLKYIDQKTFEILNLSLSQSKAWMYFWGMLNHSNESWINVIVMVCINFLAVITIKDKNYKIQSIKLIIYFWFFYEIVLLMTHFIFIDLLNIKRASPSIILQTIVSISQELNNTNLKECSNNCFPAGHALVAIYWAIFTLAYAPKSFRIIIILTTLLIGTPRLFSGAHWLSDIIFSIAYGIVCFSWAIFLYKPFTNIISNITSKLKRKLA